jgi:GT2 family glycosyltransferase
MPKVFVTLVNYNSSKNTHACLQSLGEINTEGLNLSVVVVDNASTDDSVRTISNFQFPISNKSSIKIIRSEENLGFAGGQNLGIKFALENGADYVVILNNDVILDKNLIVELFKTLTEEKDCGIVSPKIYFAKGYEFHKDRYKESELGKVIWYAGGKIDWKNVIAYHRGVDEVDKGQYEKVEQTDYASGCCEMIKKEVFEKVGFFDERYFLYYEDNDLSQRTKKKGFKIYYQPKAMLWHLNAGSAGGSGSALQDYYITRNRLLFGFNYSSLRTKIALIKESLKIIFSGRIWQKRGALDFYLGKFGKGSYRE